MAGPASAYDVLSDGRLGTARLELPLVSVVVTNYNYAPYITACLESIDRQTYPYMHCIVVDDCSTDGSVESINAFVATSAEQTRRFSLVRCSTNGGQMAAFKAGLAMATGTFVVFVDADDILFDDFVSFHVSVHLNCRPVSFTSSNQYQIDDKGAVVSGRHPDLYVKNRLKYIHSRSLLFPFWLWATTSSMMFRKAVLDIIMPSDTEPFRICADNYLCHYANLLGGSYLIPSIHGCYRRHSKNYFSANPFIGGQLPTGDMRKHPRFELVRRNIFRDLTVHHDRFLSLLGEMGFSKTLLRLASPGEIITLRRKVPSLFRDKPFCFLIRLSVLSAIILSSKVIRNYCQLIRQLVLERHKRDYFKHVKPILDDHARASHKRRYPDF